MACSKPPQAGPSAQPVAQVAPAAPASAQATRAGFGAEVDKLLQGVPAEAFLLGFLDSADELWSHLLHGFLYELDAQEKAPLDQELRAYLTLHIGLDVSKVKSAVGFGMDDDGAVLIGGVGGRIKARTAGSYAGVPLFELDPAQVAIAAQHDDVLIVGSAAGVRAALDTLSGKRESLSQKHPEIGEWIGAECGGAFLGAVVFGLDTAPPELRAMAGQFGVDRACVRFGADGLRAVFTGQPDGLATVAQWVDFGLQQMVASAEAARQKGTAPASSIILGISAITGYHYTKSLAGRLQPRLTGDRLEIKLPLQFGDPTTVVVIVGVTAAVAIPAFMKYIKRSKSSEAREMVSKLYQGARHYALAAPTGRSRRANPPRLPSPSAGPTPPLGACCAAGGKCAPAPELWRTEPWSSLGFSVDDPHYYSYQYEVVNRGREFVVRALGDLDCDGEYSTFEISGVFDPATGELPGSPPLVVDQELE